MKDILIVAIAIFGISSCHVNKSMTPTCNTVTVRDTVTLRAEHIHYERPDGLPGCHELPADTVFIENQFCQPKK